MSRKRLPTSFRPSTPSRARTRHDRRGRSRNPVSAAKRIGGYKGREPGRSARGHSRMGKPQPQSTILLPERPDPTCMYCGGSVEKNHGKGEHIIQKAIGGARTLKDRVCTRCNNNELSEVDRELCSLSFLSVVA